jgi:hypothetical protein
LLSDENQASQCPADIDLEAKDFELKPNDFKENKRLREWTQTTEVVYPKCTLH